MAALLSMLTAMLWTMPLHAETRTYMLDMYDNLGQLVATHRLQLEFEPEDSRDVDRIVGTRTVIQVDDAYRALVGGSERASGSMRGPRLRLTLSRGILSPPLEIEAVLIPGRNGAFEGRWKRFGCFHGASGTLTGWPIGPTEGQ